MVRCGTSWNTDTLDSLDSLDSLTGSSSFCDIAWHDVKASNAKINKLILLNSPTGADLTLIATLIKYAFIVNMLIIYVTVDLANENS